MDETVVSTQLLGPGDQLAGKYRIDRIIGQGGMGVVYEAFHIRLRQRVAIKMLLPEVLVHPEFVARFEREARAAATLESRNVAKVLDVDTSPQGLPYMVIEYLEGNDLSEELARRGRLPIQEAVALVMEACVPISLAHSSGIIHRDLKPSNLFLAKKDGQQILKLLDFGISKILNDTDSKDTSSLHGLGTPHYMSPEQVRRASDVDRRSDIWSLGIILYELLTGTEPFSGPPPAIIAAIVADPIPRPRARRPDIPEALERVIMHALEKNPDKRYADVRLFMKALAPFAPEEERVPVLPTPQSIPPWANVTQINPQTVIVRKPARRGWLYVAIPLSALVVMSIGVTLRAVTPNVADAAIPIERPRGVAVSVTTLPPPPLVETVAPIIVAVPVPTIRPNVPPTHTASAHVASPQPAASNPFTL